MASDARDELPESGAGAASKKAQHRYAVLIGVAIVGALGLLLSSGIRSAREAARVSSCNCHLKQIGLALQNYADANGRQFPPAYTLEANGKRLHSWRTLIFNYMEQLGVYNAVDLSQPWDAPANENARNTQMSTYQCPSANLPANHTIYLALVGPGSALEGGRARPLSEITDGASNTAIIIEVPADLSVPWMAPEDADEALFLSLGSNSKLPHPRGFNVLMADGSVRFLKADTPADVRKALFTCDAHDPLPTEF